MNSNDAKTRYNRVILKVNIFSKSSKKQPFSNLFKLIWNLSIDKKVVLMAEKGGGSMKFLAQFINARCAHQSEKGALLQHVEDVRHEAARLLGHRAHQREVVEEAEAEGPVPVVLRDPLSELPKVARLHVPRVPDDAVLDGEGVVLRAEVLQEVGEVPGGAVHDGAAVPRPPGDLREGLAQELGRDVGLDLLARLAAALGERLRDGRDLLLPHVQHLGAAVRVRLHAHQGAVLVLGAPRQRRHRVGQAEAAVLGRRRRQRRLLALRRRGRRPRLLGTFQAAPSDQLACSPTRYRPYLCTILNIMLELYVVLLQILYYCIELP